MKFLLDHDVPEDLSYLLERLGHHVTPLRKARPPAIETIFWNSQPGSLMLGSLS